MTEDAELLEHYVRRGREAWNVSLEAAWLDYELRAYVLAHLPKRRPLRVLNVGIGVGLWDDWLGHVVGGVITSVDRDPEICRIFALRQRREQHPYPARVVCGDIGDGILAEPAGVIGSALGGGLGDSPAGVIGSALGGERFDVITCIGSTLAESGDRGRTQRALHQLLAPHGLLLGAEVGQGAAADRVRTCGDIWLACSTRTCPT